MMYALGIDLGTTFTAAATWRDGHTEVASLGSRAAVIPSVVLLRDDETVLTGEAASRRGLSEPQRVAREFKRRFGDSTPILLGGSPYSAEALSAKLLRAVIDDVAAREGGHPARICISHPANWGPYKRDLLSQLVRLADVRAPVSFTTEPEAAAVFYAHQQRIEHGALVAVYDLGGGTFDATVLRKTEAGFEILGQPEGIERLGGIDFDAAVFAHVRQALDGKLAELDEDDPAAIAAVARLRGECVEAKEALSSDTDTSIPVLLPNMSTEIRLTRAELEAMVRPTLHSTIEALRRALRSASVSPEQLHSVLLVGGSSRMPLVSQLVGAELGRPVAVDAHPKHAVALGAAWLAGGARQRQPQAQGRQVPRAVPVPPPAVPPQQQRQPAPTERRPQQPTEFVPVVNAQGGPPPAAPATPPRGADQPAGSPGRRAKRLLLVGAGVLVIALLARAGVWAMNRDNTPGAGADPNTTTTTAPKTTKEKPQVPADEQCTDAIKSNERWVCLTGARFDGEELVIDYQADWAGGTPNINGGFHLHIWGSDGTAPPDDVMGTHAGDGRGNWVIKDQLPAVLSAADVAEVIGDEPKACARIANSEHQLVPVDEGSYGTGNCVPIER
ncbi:MAG: Hsp70 family protein [Actinophytocola sp.]|nr:Hsp70 family protein [Actinophytocola sp.]